MISIKKSNGLQFILSDSYKRGLSSLRLYFTNKPKRVMVPEPHKVQFFVTVSWVAVTKKSVISDGASNMQVTASCSNVHEGKMIALRNL